MSSLANDAGILRKRGGGRHAGCRPELTLRTRRGAARRTGHGETSVKVGEAGLKSIAPVVT